MAVNDKSTGNVFIDLSCSFLLTVENILKQSNFLMHNWVKYFIFWSIDVEIYVYIFYATWADLGGQSLFFHMWIRKGHE